MPLPPEPALPTGTRCSPASGRRVHRAAARAPPSRRSPSPSHSWPSSPTPLGAAIERTLDGFSAWLTGEPGTPASEQEQNAFDQANARSCAAFPAGTELRKLLVTRSAGATFTLYGFRGGESLCLRLVADGAVEGTSTSCAPLRALRTAKAPALVVATDYRLARRSGSTAASSSSDSGTPRASLGDLRHRRRRRDRRYPRRRRRQAPRAGRQQRLRLCRLPPGARCSGSRRDCDVG